MIATTVSTHYPLAMEAMKAGKHVFVEKPFAETTAKAEEMVAFAEEKKTGFHGGPHIPLFTSVLKIKQILDSKELETYASLPATGSTSGFIRRMFQ